MEDVKRRQEHQARKSILIKFYEALRKQIKKIHKRALKPTHLQFLLAPPPAEFHYIPIGEPTPLPPSWVDGSAFANDDLHD